MTLQPVTFGVIQPFYKHFQYKSKTYEDPPNGSLILGIYLDDILAGYFIVCSYQKGELEINQGYLRPSAQHQNLSKQAMALLEQKAKQDGYKRIILASSRTLKAYTKFMASMGYKPERIIFSKGI